MIRRTSITIALLASLGCSSRATEATPTPQSADAFAGTWRSVTPSDVRAHSPPRLTDAPLRAPPLVHPA